MTVVGETVNITFYESFYPNAGCKKQSYSGRATRCSEDRGGVVYIMDDAMSGGDDTFCVMD